MTTDHNAMTPNQIVAAVGACIDADLPVLMTGAPGIGKSDIVRQIAAERGWPVIDMRLVTTDPVDLRGLPVASDGRAIFLPMGELPDADRDGDSGILFLDELPQAPMAVQNAAFSLVLDRRIGDYRLPPGWRVIAAGNRIQDRAGANRLNSALADRFTQFAVGVSVDGWCRWALQNGLQPELVAFVRMRPDLLHSFEPDRSINATPRSWAMADKLLKAKLAPEVEMHALAGTVGQGPAAELIGFLRIWRQLPSPDAVLMNPDRADVPTSGATLYALTGALARKVTDATMDAFVKYLGRIPPEYGVAAMKTATALKPDLQATPAFIAWASENADVHL